MINLSPRYLRIAGLAIAVVILSAAAKVVQGGGERGSLNTAQSIQLDGTQIKLVENESRSEEDALDTQSGDIEAKLARANELATGDLQQLICARAGQYLASAAQYSLDDGIDELAWLNKQLKLENNAIKEGLINQSSFSGQVHHLNMALMPLVNRVAITQAISSLRRGEMATCRAMPYESAQAIDEAVLASESKRLNRKQWAIASQEEGLTDE